MAFLYHNHRNNYPLNVAYRMYFDRHSYVFLNGRFIKAQEASTSLFTQSLHYGNAAFDAMRAYDTPLGAHIFKAKEHYQRLLHSASKMYIRPHYSTEELVHITYELLRLNRLTNAYIRPLLFSGIQLELAPSEEINLFIGAWKWDKYLGKDLVDVMTSSYTRPSPRSCAIDAKISGHYVNSMIAAAEARQAGYDDALLLDVDGFVAEGTGANFFYEKNGLIYTPPRGSILPGITRATIMELAKEIGIEVVEKQIRPEELHEIDGAFFTGTAMQVTGFRSLNGKPFRKKWEDTYGYVLFHKYGQRVMQNEYDNYSII